MKKNRISVRNMVMCAVFAAVTAILSQIAIPMPFGVPITLQTLAAALCGCVLGSLYGTVSVGVYILIGAVGAPVFASMRGGFGVLFGVTGGFIFGFLPLAFLCGIRCKKWIFSLLLGVCGVLLCHAAGVLQFSLISGTSLVQSFLTVSLPYIPKDIISAAAAYFFSRLLQKRMRGVDG